MFSVFPAWTYLISVAWFLFVYLQQKHWLQMNSFQCSRQNIYHAVNKTADCFMVCACAVQKSTQRTLSALV